MEVGEYAPARAPYGVMACQATPGKALCSLEADLLGCQGQNSFHKAPVGQLV
jgi:hypothetical protein